MELNFMELFLKSDQWVGIGKEVSQIQLIQSFRGGKKQQFPSLRNRLYSVPT